MRIPALLTLAFCTLSCGRSPPQVHSQGSTSHKIPEDSTPLVAAFAEVGGQHRYIVFAYGRQRPLVAEPDHILVDGQRVDVPTSGNVYVVDDKLRLHKSNLEPGELRAPLWEGTSQDFFKGQRWQELYSLLKEHRWKE